MWIPKEKYMVHLQKANFHSSSIYDIDIAFLASLERKIILIDLDNTLAAHNIMVPSAQTHKLMQELINSQLVPIIVSNRGEKRVKPFCQQLRVSYLSSAHKPKTKKIKKLLAEIGMTNEDVIIIGDQIFTDMKLAKNLNAFFILTDPISTKDHITTKPVRWIERPLRKKYHKMNMLGRRAPKRKIEEN